MARKVVVEDVPVCAAHTPEAPVQDDIFKRLGATTVGGVTTMSFGAAIAGGVTLKTVTIKGNSQSEALLFIEDCDLAPTSVEGYYKVVSL
jgi:hypothetical protein